MRGWSTVIALAPAVLLIGCGSSASTGPASAPVAAAAPAPRPIPKASNSAGLASAVTPDPPSGYTYQADGRRDPFVNLLTSVVAAPGFRAPLQRGEGIAGLTVSEIMVRGIVQMNGRATALIQGSDGRSYNIHEGDKLADGTVKSVTAEGLVIMQVDRDPTSATKPWEVRKLMRSVEDAKP